MPLLTRRRLGALAAALPAGAHAAPLPDMPAHACDCHVHIIGPLDRFPMVPGRAYTPPQSTVAGLEALHQKLGIQRTVLIQPSFYGTDNRAMLEALAAMGDRARGIAVLAPDVSDAELARLDGLGVRGIRVNIESGGSRDPRDVTRDLGAFADRVKHLGWHIQIYAALSVISRVAPEVTALSIPVVFDHFGMPDAALGPAQSGFGTLLDMVRSGHAYVKLSAPYRISKLPGYTDAAPIARALIEAGPDRLVWASDWPHTDHAVGKTPVEISPFRVVNDSAVLDLLPTWCPDAATRRAILVDTPQRLYRFPA